MSGIINFETFIISSVILNVTPGADTLYILGRSISQGKKAGVLSALGISTGSVFHIVLATLGLSAILVKSATVFEVIKYLGAVYLIILGLKSIFGKTETNREVTVRSSKDKMWKIYLSGILTNVLNPKVAIFFLAFLPQFIEPTIAGNALPFLILGMTFLFTGTIWCIVLALFASKLSGKLQKSYKIRQWLSRLAGFTFLGLGVKLAMTKK